MSAPLSASPVPRLQSRNWVFTLNNPEESELAQLIESCQYLVYQREKGENETEHYQGYCCFAANKRLAAVRRLVARAHWEVRLGTHAQAFQYCTKEDTRIDAPVEVGFHTDESGKRNDLDALKAAIDKGTSLSELYGDYFSQMVRYGRGINTYRSFVSERTLRSECKVYVLYGPTGTGKTTAAEAYLSELPGGIYRFEKSENGSVWWDGYDGERSVLFDEFYGKTLPWSVLLRICQPFPARVWTKGARANFLATNIFITTNQPPCGWYNYTGHMEYATLYRRLFRIVHCVSLDHWELVK